MNLLKVWLVLGSSMVCFLAACGSSTSGVKCDGNATCNNHGRCDTPGGQIVCICDTGFGGDRCEKCADGYKNVSGACVQMTSCSEQGACLTEHKTVCDDSSGHVVCSCDQGYTEVSGGTCNSLCEQSSPCTDTTHHKTQCKMTASGAAICLCDIGYISKGDDCVQAISCSPTNPCTNTNQTKCDIDSQGHVVCSCDPGFKDDGTGGCESICVDLNPCESLSDPHKTKCVTNAGNYSCSCADGYHDFGDGTCQPSTQCSSANCTEPHKSICNQDTHGNITCSCDNGYELKDQTCKLKEGGACQNPNECSSGFCANNTCCHTQCNGNCQICNGQNTKGTCTPNPAANCGECGVCDASTGNCMAKQDLCPASGSTLCTTCTGSQTTFSCTYDNTQSANDCPSGSECYSKGSCRKSNHQSCSGPSECMSEICQFNICLWAGATITAACPPGLLINNIEVVVQGSARVTSNGAIESKGCTTDTSGNPYCNCDWYETLSNNKCTFDFVNTVHVTVDSSGVSVSLDIAGINICSGGPIPW